MTIKILQTQEELELVLPYFHELIQQHHYSMPHLFKNQSYEYFLEQILQYRKEINNKDMCIAFKENDQYVAFVYGEERIRDNPWYTKNHHFFIQCFIVDSNFRNKGIGKKAFALLKELLNQQNIPRIELYVDTNNTHAMNLYKNMGLQSEGMYMSTLI